MGGGGGGGGEGGGGGGGGGWSMEVALPVTLQMLVNAQPVHSASHPLSSASCSNTQPKEGEQAPHQALIIRLYTSTFVPPYARLGCRCLTLLLTLQLLMSDHSSYH